MNARVGISLAIVSFFACITAACGTVLPKAGSVEYKNWGFKVDIPLNSEKISLADGTDDLYDVYSYKGLSYVVKIIKTPSNALASTAIEQQIQADCKKTGAKRWETETRKGELYKGLEGVCSLDNDILAKAPKLKAAISNGTVFQAISMAPLKDESSPILYVGVIGPRSRATDIRNIAKFMPETVSTNIIEKSVPPVVAQPKAPQPPAPGKAIVTTVQKPAMVTVKPATPVKTPKVTVTPASKKPANQPSFEKPAVVATPHKRPAIKAGYIQLEGEITSIWSNNKGLVCSVDTVTMPSKTEIELSPKRSKTVMLDKCPMWIKQGIRVLVIGKNNGIGKPIHADIIEAASSK